MKRFIFILMGFILFLVIFSDQGNYEFFDGISEKDLKNINDGVNSVISCKKEGESCGEDKVRNFNEFKKKYGYKKFNTMFFLKLLRKRKEMDKDFIASEINEIIKEGDYGDSLNVTETFGIIETMGDSKSDCIDSVRDFKEAIEASHAEDEALYEKRLKKWQEDKAKIELEFNSKPERWQEVCSRSRCEPADLFFDAHPDTDVAFHVLGGTVPFAATKSTCMAACRDKEKCAWITHVNGMCYLKAPVTWKGVNVGIKTSTGFRRIDNAHGNHYLFNMGTWQHSPTQDDCEQKCIDNKGCWWYSWWNIPNLYGKPHCLLKHDGHIHGTGHWAGWKKKVASFVFSDKDPYITDKIGEKPKMEYRPVPVAEFVCMDCSSNMRDVTSEDSKEVAINQLNQCVGKLRGSVTQQGPLRGSATQQGPPPKPQYQPPPANTKQETKAETTTNGNGGVGTGTIVGAAVGGTTSIVSSSSFFAILLIGGIYFATRK